MYRKWMALSVMLILSTSIMYGQVSLSGKVVDVDNLPLIGANISLSTDRSSGTTTDFDGMFQLTVPSLNETLIVSYTGYQTKEVPINGQSNVTIVLDEGIELGEVVVTALGIEREKNSLTFALQSVEGEDLTESRDINFLNSLSGKAAGVEIKKSSSGPGGSTRVVLRGNKSLSGNSEPLFVIDGIPMANNKGSQPGMWGGWDSGDGMSQLNPDDIESISILKGANAAALYGSQGANGVVLITTKKGKEGKAVVNVTSGLTTESILLKPDLQFRYGSEGGTKESWSTSQGNYSGDYVDDFFQTGTNFINSVSISGGNERTKAYFSYGNVSAKGIVPNNTYNRNNVTFKQSTKLADDRLTLGSNVILTLENAENRPAAGYYLNPLTGLYFFPRDKDFNSFRENYSILDETRNVEKQNWFVEDHHQSNPYWLINRQPSLNQTKRIIGSMNANYQINDKMSVAVRGSYDFAAKLQEQKFYGGGNTTNIHANGRWDYNRFSDELLYTDAIFRYDDRYGDFGVGLVTGTSYQKSVFGEGVSVNTGTNGLLYANEFYFQNLPTNVIVSSNLSGRLVKQSIFANATVDYKEMFYVDFTGRNDWASSLAGTGNDSYFYPSIGFTAILTKMLDFGDVINFAKLRFSSNNVGNEVPFNRINPQNTINAGGGVDRNTKQPFENLKPELIQSNELGLNLRFLDDNLGLDLTYYNISSTDQFIELDAPSGSGYTKYFVNAGEIVNKGVEIVLDATPVFTPNFLWKTAFNFAKNINEVVELHPDLPNAISTGSSEGYDSKFVAGGSIGDVYVHKFVRDDQGRIVLDSNSGRPTKTPTTELIGNLNPDWSLGWNNDFSYKDWSLNFQINGNFGGVCVSQTEAMLDGFGVTERSAVDRDRGHTIINAVKDEIPVTQIDPKLYYTTIGDRNGIKEPYVYDRTNVRLTQLALSYRTNILGQQNPLTISIVGQNLWLLYLEAPFDPELAMSTNRNNQSLDNFNTPATRTIGFNISVKF